MLTPPLILVNMCLHGLEIFLWGLAKFSPVCLEKFHKHRDFILATTCAHARILIKLLGLGGQTYCQKVSSY
jgi:hypothetical protein